MAFADVITNAVSVVRELGYVEADKRRPIEDQSDMGADRCFQVSAEPITVVLDRHGIPDNVRMAQLRVRTAFFAGGGNAGGAAFGGDRKNVNARAFEQCIAMAQRLGNQHRYDANNTGIRRRINPRWDIVENERRVEEWDLTMDTEWQQGLDPRAVPA